MVRSIFSVAAVLAASTLIQGCATQPVTWGQAIEKEGIVFNFPSASTTREIKAAYGTPTRTNDSFIRIEVEMLNKNKEPITYGRQPVFKLADETGAKYEVHGLQTIKVNSGRPNSIVTGAINPNVKYTKEIVFEVPRGRQYVLEVRIPPPVGSRIYTPTGAGDNSVDFRVALPPDSQPK